MGDDALICGWPGGVKPANAVDMRDDARMATWADRSAKIAVRIDPRDDGMVRIDSDIARQLGLMPEH